MENQPLISPQSRFQEIVQHHHHQQDDDTDPDFYFNKPRRPLHRCSSAPAMVLIEDLKTNLIFKTPETKKPSPIKQAIFLLIIYLTLGVSVISFNRDLYSGIKTHPVVDALYLCIVTMCTVGYGDIAPLTPWTKIFAMVFVLLGFGFINILLRGVVHYVLDLQQSIHFERGRRMKVCLALCVVVSCVGVGALVLHFVEGLDLVDSVYLSVMSVTTVGGGGRPFKTLQGRLFAAAWLLVSTLAVARAFLSLAEARIDRRHRRAVKSALKREITVADLLTPDTYQRGFISKSEYIVSKLKEMGKISDKDISQVVNHFDKLDPNNLGKITLSNLLGV